MGVTIHVNGRTNSLAHKGSTGFAKSTLPDVCKTPSPGGPVPIPYPIILSTTSDLTGGTTTVKADGGNMAAVKGSELSRCNGDEAGTAGGVKSSTNMKEATWILYSFDVKLEGKNACRLTDKLQMNHGNSACLGGIIQSPVDGATVLRIDCRTHWTPCQKAQMRAKIAAMNAAAGPGGHTMFPYDAATRLHIGNLRNQGANHQAAYRTNPARAPYATAPPHPDVCPPDNEGRDSDADHTTELQMGGNPQGPMRMLDSAVNRSCGAQIMWQRRRNPGGMTVARIEPGPDC
jgi:hypothetical protein